MIRKKIEHGMTIGNKHTYTDYGLVPTSRPVFQSPKPIREILEIPGKNGVLDYSTALTGTMVYNEREGKFEFLVDKKRKWNEIFSLIQNEVHGTCQRIILDDDPLFYYECYLEVDEWKSSELYSTITILAKAYPYKKKLFDTIITKTLSSTETEVKCNNLREPVVPTFETTGNTTIKFGNLSKTVGAGKHTLDIVFKAGENIVKASGTGTLKIIYREGGL